MIEMGKSYRTRDGREVRIYAVDGGTTFPVQGAIRSDDGDEWRMNVWKLDGRNFANGKSTKDLVESDPHGILPRHRELLASVYEGQLYDDKADFDAEGKLFTNFLKTADFSELAQCDRAALIALAKQDQERGGADASVSK